MVREGFRQTDIGLIPEDWEAYTVGQLVTFSGGAQPDKSIFLRRKREGYIRLIQIRDYKTDKFLTYIPDHLARKRCDAQDIMIGRYGPPIFQILRGIQGAYNVALIKATPNEKLDREFLYHFIRNEQLFALMDSLSRRSSGQTGVELPALREYPLALPSLSEQKEIAKALSDTDELIVALENLIGKKRDIKAATMQQLLTGKKRLLGFGVGKGYKKTELGEIPEDWDIKSYGEIFQFLTTATNSRSDLSEDGSYYYIHYGDIHTKYDYLIDFEKARPSKISSEKFSCASLLRDGDLIMADASEDYEGIGKSVEVMSLGEKTAISGLHTFLLRDSDEIFVSGYRGYLHTIEPVKKAFDRLATGLKVYGLSKNNLKQILLPIPTSEEQKGIIKILLDMRCDIDALENRLEKTRAIKQGMMQELLTGRTRLVALQPAVEEQVRKHGT